MRMINMKRKNIVLFILVFVLFLIFVFLLSYRIFGNKVFFSKKYELELNEKSISLVDLSPVSDSEGLKNKPYVFEVKNKNKHNVSYKLFINDSTDNIKNENVLSRNNLKFQLKLNDKIILSDSLGNLKNNVLDTNYVNGKSSNRYELVIWLSDELGDNWMDKSYGYNISIEEVNR